MNLPAHGSYTIEQQGNILLVDARGPFNEVTLTQCQQDMKDSNHADLQQMQLRRVYQSSGIIFHVFSDVNSAKEWLKDFLDSQRATILSKDNMVRFQLSV